MRRFIILIAVFMLSLSPAFAWWNCAWKYRVPITISNSLLTSLSNFQVNLTIDTASLIAQGKLRPDCGDLRFTYYDPTTGQEVEIPYWIESGCNTTSTKIWIKVPYIPASGSSLVYMYYGNPTALSESNYKNVLDVVGEAGIASVGGTPTTITFLHKFTNPVVFASPYFTTVVSRSGTTEAQHPTIFKVTSVNFTINQTEDPTGNYDGIPTDGTTADGVTTTYVSWIALEQGTYYIGLNLLAQVGTTTATPTYSRLTTGATPITFGVAYSLPPSLLLSSQSINNGITWIFARGTGVTATGASVQVETDPSSTAAAAYGLPATFTNTETVAYAAIQQGYDPINHFETHNATASNTPTAITFTSPYSTNPVVVSTLDTKNGGDHFYALSEGVTTAGFDIAGEEPASWDGGHIAETFSWIAVPAGLIYGRKYASTPPTVTIGTEQVPGLESVEITSPLNLTSLTSTSLTVTAKGVAVCTPTLTKANLTFSYPVNAVIPMTCSGDTCTATVDLNTLLKGVGIASNALPLDYNVTATDSFDITKSSTTHVNYIRTSHNVTIIYPTPGSIVLGTGFQVIAKTDSLFDITNCTLNLPPGATVTQTTVDKADKECIFWVDLANYCGVNYISFNASINNTVGVNETSPTVTHYIYDPQIVVKFVAPTPANGSQLSLRYLPIKVEVNKYPVSGQFLPTTRKFIFQINGTNYTIYGDSNGYAEVTLYHKGAVPATDANGTAIATLYDLLGNLSGNITFKVYGLGRCGYYNATELRVVTVPRKIFKVDFVPPTPADGNTTNLLFIEVQGKVYNNILADPECELWVSKDNGFTWIKLKDMDNCYSYIVNNEFDLNNLYYDAVTGYYVLKYKIVLKDSRWGEYNESVVHTLYISPNAEPIPTVNSGMSVETIQKTIDSAIANNKPAVLFEPGLYRVNIVVDPQGKNIKLLGANSVLTAEAKGFPVITIKSGNVSLERFNIQDSLFNIKITSGYANLYKVNVQGGLYGVQVSNAQVTIKNSTFNSKLAGIYATNIYNSTISGVVSTGNVWGAYLQNANNVLIDPSSFEGKVFGIYLAGNSNNNTIEDVNVNAKVFGILMDGKNNTINHANIYAEVFGIKTPGGNTIENVTIDGIKVFGIYSTQPNIIKNVLIKKANVFGLFITGNATNVTILNSKLGASLNGKGEIDYLKLGDTEINVSYDGSLMLSQADSKVNVPGVSYTGQAINVLGRGIANITFLYNNPKYSQYFVYKVLGTQANIVATGKFVSTDSVGLYALYGS